MFRTLNWWLNGFRALLQRKNRSPLLLRCTVHCCYWISSFGLAWEFIRTRRCSSSERTTFASGNRALHMDPKSPSSYALQAPQPGLQLSTATNAACGRIGIGIGCQNTILILPIYPKNWYWYFTAYTRFSPLFVVFSPPTSQQPQAPTGCQFHKVAQTFGDLRSSFWNFQNDFNLSRFLGGRLRFRRHFKQCRETFKDRATCKANGMGAR